MYLVKTPPLIKTLFSDFIWNIETTEKTVYLTFDDGPIPGITPWILDLLSEYNFKATFFCVGENIRNNYSIYKRIKEEGHITGNHTYNHLNGWLTDYDTYLNNVMACDQYQDSNLFRPPYGKIRRKQVNALKSDKNIVMWDVLSGDFDLSISKEKCLNNVIDNYVAGSIIVFHDNIKSEEKIKFVLPLFFEHLVNNGFTSSNLECLMHEFAEA